MLALRLIKAVTRLLDLERPAVVIGTGGYASGPVVWRGGGGGGSTGGHGAKAAPGGGAPRGPRVLDPGSPIVPPDPGLRPAALERFGLSSDRPVVLVTGGSQGALAVNRAVAEWLNAGHPGAGGIDAQIIWTTGRPTYEQFKAYHRPPAVQVFEFLDPMSYAYAVADLAISRAGMMTLAELCAWGIPSILIPLPTAAADHQTPNARWR